MKDELPEGWTSANIGDVCSLVNGRAFKSAEWSRAGLPIVRIQNLNDPNAPFNHFAGELDPKHRIEHGELLFAWSGTPGTSFGAHIWKQSAAALNQHIYRVLFSENQFDKRFLRLAINHRLDDLIDAAHGGAGLAHVTKSVFETTDIAFPPLEEQTRIVERLETLLHHVSCARERLIRARDILKALRQSLVAAACSGRLTESWRSHRGLTDQAGEALPQEWRAVSLSEVMTGFETGRSLNAAGRQARDEEFGVLKISAVTWGEFRAEENKALPIAHQPRAHEIVKGGDLLITRANTSDLVGAVALVPADYPVSGGRLVLPDKILRILPDESLVIPEYLLHALRTAQVRELFAQTATGTSDSMRNLSQPKLAQAPIALPPLAEQHVIVEGLRRVFQSAEAAERQVASTMRLAGRLQQAILGVALRGQLALG